MSDQEEWEAILAAEGLREDPPVKRLRKKASDRRRGDDPQPRREVSYDAWDQRDKNWTRLTSSPQTKIEALMLGEDDSVEEQGERFDDLLQQIAEIHEGALLVLGHMTEGTTESQLVQESGLSRVEIRDTKKAIRAMLVKRYGLEPEEML